MLSRQHKLSRASFPAHKDFRLNWVGSVLRIQAYAPVVTGTLSAQNKRGTQALFAVVVAKRFAQSAVLRHAFKRQVLRIVAGALSRFAVLPYDKYVVFPKGALADISPSAVVKDIDDFLLQHTKQ